MRINSYLIAYSFLFVSALVVKIYEFNIIDAVNYFTNKHYVSLVNSISQSESFNLQFLVVESASNIASPEPSLSIIYYFITRLFSVELSFYVVSMLYLFTIAIVFICINKSYDKLIYTLIFGLPYFFGFYEFVLLGLTHRLKISLIFLVLYFYFNHKKMPIFSFLSLTGMLLSHISTILFVPFLIVFMYSRDRFSFQIVKYASILYLLIFSILSILLPHELSFLVKKIAPHISTSNVPYVMVISILLLSTNFFGLFYPLRSKYLNTFGFIFLALFLLYFIGTGRLLMLLYFLLFYIILFFYVQKKLTFVQLMRLPLFNFFLILWFYNIVKGLHSNPLFTSSFIF